MGEREKKKKKLLHTVEHVTHTHTRARAHARTQTNALTHAHKVQYFYSRTVERSKLGRRETQLLRKFSLLQLSLAATERRKTRTQEKERREREKKSMGERRFKMKENSA